MINAAEILDRFSRAEDKNELVSLLSYYVKQMGFDYYSYYLHHPLPATRPITRILDTYPVGWMDYYQDEGYLTIDPTLKLSQVSHDMVIWDERVFEQAESLWSDAQAAGLKYGLAQSTFGPTMSFGVLSVARGAHPLSTKLVDELRMPIMWLSNQFHNALITKTIRQEIAPPAELTNREIEILKWTVDGKTAGEIAQINGISTRTVNFHVCNTLDKLEVVNKTQAAVRAFSLGILTDL